MTTVVRPLALALTAAFAAVLLSAPAVTAAPSCVAQSVQAEHEAYGTAWGAELVAFLARHPEVLQEFGFQHFGDLVSYAAQQDPTSCPPGL